MTDADFLCRIAEAGYQIADPTQPNYAGRDRVASVLGIHRDQARTFLRRHKGVSSGSGQAGKVDKPELTETREQHGDALVITLPKTRICTLEQLLAHCKVDTAVWAVEKWICNKWEVGAKDAAKRLQIEPLFQVKAWLKKKAHAAAALEEIDALRKKAEVFAPVYPTLIFKDRSKSENLVELSIADHHFGRNCWGRETGGADYDTKIAKRVYEDAFTTLIARTKGYGIDEVLLPIGNDLQHTDNRQGTTTRGTPQDTDSRYQKVFETARDSIIWSIEAAMTLAPKVKCVMVSGNHDFLTTWHLGDTLRAWFRNCRNVTVDNEPTFRKYHQHGTVGLMFSHGNSGKLEEYPLVMASEKPAMWGATRWHEAHTGDKHQRRLVELKGAAVRILPSLCPPDAWTSENCYIGAVRAAEAYVWNYSAGLIGTAVYSVLPEPDGSVAKEVAEAA